MSTYFVRIKPYNKATGCLVRGYAYKGRQYLEGKGWYRAKSDTEALEMAKLRCDASNPSSQFVFDVKLPVEAAELDAAEVEIEEKRPAKHAREAPASAHKAPRPRKPQGARVARVAQPVQATETEIAGLDEAFGDDTADELGPPRTDTTEE